MSTLWPIVNNHVVEAQTFLTVVISVTAVRHKEYNEYMGVPFCPFGTEGTDQLSVWLSKCDSLFQLHCLPMFFPHTHPFIIC